MTLLSSDGLTDLAQVDLPILAVIQAATHILCVSHVGPDGDAVGSLLGMGLILRHLHKQPVLALQDRPSNAFAFLPGYGDIVGPHSVGANYDLIICLDASSPDRMGRIYRAADHRHIPLLVIDHHITNTYFGTYHWVEPRCAATCQMLVYLADALDVPLQGDLAQVLLTGVVTDTLGFRTSNTTSRVLEAAMRLLEGGGNLLEVVEQTLRRTSLSMVRLWGDVLPQVQLDEGIIWLTISRAQRRAVHLREDESDGLANHLITVDGADISATFIEKMSDKGAPLVECSFRARQGFNVSDVAFALGGGGHPAAAGCTLPGPLAEIAAQVVATLKASHQQQRTSAVAAPSAQALRG